MPEIACKDRVRMDFVFIMQSHCHKRRKPSLANLRSLSQSCGKLKRTAELGWRDANHAPENLREMARVTVTRFKSDLNETARCFADQLLCAGHALAGNELERSHARGLLEDMSKVRGTQFHQFGETFDRDVLRE